MDVRQLEKATLQVIISYIGMNGLPPKTTSGAGSEMDGCALLYFVCGCDSKVLCGRLYAF